MPEGAALVPRVVLVPVSYPWDGAAEATFLDGEIARLADHFDLVVMPMTMSGSRLPIDPRARVDASLASIGRLRRVLALVACIADPALWREVAEAPRRFLGLHAWRRALAHVRGAAFARRAILRAATGAQTAIAYSYWFDAATSGALAARRARPDLVVVTRAHGGDLFHDRDRTGYIPARRRDVAAVARVFSVSRYGADYLRRRYPEAAHRIAYAPMGTPDPGFSSLPNHGERRHVVSCAYCVPVKRLHLVVAALASAARAAPALRLAWTHLGGGPGLADLRALASRELAGLVDCAFAGTLANADVVSFYREHRVDLFIGLSASEGRPVSMMEAASAAIPILSTSVGGVPELVGDDNGALVAVEDDAATVGAALAAQLARPAGERLAQRHASRRRWADGADAARVYADFAATLAALADQRPATAETSSSSSRSA